MIPSYRTSKACPWVHPRPHRDASQRYHTHGKVQSMDEPGFFARIFGARK